MKKKDKTPFLLKLIRWFFPKLERIAPALANRYFVKVFFSPLNYRVPEKEKEFLVSAERFSLKVGGKRVQGYRWGKSGPVVVVVHGWAGRATQFRKFIQALTKAGFQVIGFDGPAHGLSEGKQTNLIEFAEILKLIFINDKPVAVIAHSFGGVATLCAVMNGLPLRKLINIASPTIGDEVINTYLRAINGSSQTGEAFKKYMIKKYGKSFDEFSSLYFIQHLPLPIDLLLVQDEDDKEVTIQHALELQKRYPLASLLRTSGLGHTRILKDDAVIARCIEFIRQP